MARYLINTDGGARGNPGPAGLGVVIRDPSGAVIRREHRFVGVATNNEAEYQAAVLGLETLKKIVGTKKTPVELKLDSELVARQLRGEYQIKEERLWPWFVKIWNLRVARFPDLLITHVPRSENAEADALANQAMDEGTR